MCSRGGKIFWVNFFLTKRALKTIRNRPKKKKKQFVTSTAARPVSGTSPGSSSDFRRAPDVPILIQRLIRAAQASNGPQGARPLPTAAI